MRTDYDSGLKATVTWDDAGRIRGILYFDKYREMGSLRGRTAAEAYIRDIAGSFSVPPEALRSIDQPVSYLEPREQGVEYRFNEEKVSFDTVTYIYDQTYLNAPVWDAGIAVTIKEPPTRVVAANDTSQGGIDAKLPSSDALARYRQLFATGEKVDGPPSPPRPRGAEIRGSDLLAEILGDTAKIATGRDEAPRLIQGRFFIYRYDAKERTKSESLTLPLRAVPKSIQGGSWYLVAELVFRLPYGRTRMNWRILVEVETNAVLYVRALSSEVAGNVFTYDPVTSTGKAGNTADQSNDTLRHFWTLEELRNLDPPNGGMQSLEGKFAKVVNITSPNFDPPTRPAGKDFDQWKVRTNEFAAVNAYYHVDRFFRLVEDLGFPVIGPNSYFKDTNFPVEVDHRAIRAPWPDVNTVNAALVGSGRGIDSVYFALADFRSGPVSEVTVTNPGRDYTSAPQVTFTGVGGGSGATATAHISGGAVTSVTLNHGGRDYKFPPLVGFVGGGGTGAFATAEIEDKEPIGIATDWRVTLHELGGHGTLWPHVEDDQFKFAHSAGDSFAMILNDYCSKWHDNGHVGDRFLFLPFEPQVIVRRSNRGVTEQSLARVRVTDPGSGYLTVSLSEENGVNEAKAVANVAAGVVTQVTVTDPGTGYSSEPLVNFSGGGGGSGATATAQLASGSVVGVTVTNGGSGYVTPPIVNFIGGGPARAGVVPKHILGTKITRVTVRDPGTGYTKAPKVTISGGGGTGAKAIAQIVGGSLAAVIVTDGGSGYSSVSVNLSGGGAAAAAKAAVNPEDIVDRRVTKVTVADPGTGYATKPTVTISGGGGTGAQGIAELGTWGWGQGMDQGTDGRIGSGYFSEQILSTTMFRVYQSIGGDATSINRRKFAARYMAYLMLRAIGQLAKNKNRSRPAISSASCKRPMAATGQRRV